ncbi:hypothetical protein CSUI_007337, partial [Cystoisospora suis]
MKAEGAAHRRTVEGPVRQMPAGRNGCLWALFLRWPFSLCRGRMSITEVAIRLTG